MLNGKYLWPASGVNGHMRKLQSSASICVTSSALSTKSNRSMFSAMRPALLDLGIGTVPMAICDIRSKNTIGEKLQQIYNHTISHKIKNTYQIFEANLRLGFAVLQRQRLHNWIG